VLMRRNVAAGIGFNEQGEYCRAALQRSDRKEPRYKWPTTLLYSVDTRAVPNILFVFYSVRIVGQIVYSYSVE